MTGYSIICVTGYSIIVPGVGAAGQLVLAHHAPPRAGADDAGVGVCDPPDLDPLPVLLAAHVVLAVQAGVEDRARGQEYCH